MKSVDPAPTPVRGASLWPPSVEAYHPLGETTIHGPGGRLASSTVPAFVPDLDSFFSK